MSDVAADSHIVAEYPALSESLWQAASQQLRNMATIGGNLLQRTRCAYFRGGEPFACNKRNPGSGCAALGGIDRGHAVLGGSDACIAVYPGDLAIALVAFDASIDVLGRNGQRTIPVEALHREPGSAPHIETMLQPDELILRIRMPRTAMGRASTYHKVRDRESYAFALASAAVALDMDGDTVRMRFWSRSSMMPRARPERLQAASRLAKRIRERGPIRQRSGATRTRYALLKLTAPDPMYGPAARCKRDDSSAGGAAVLHQCIRPRRWSVFTRSGPPWICAQTITSADGTTIAYEKIGSGPAIIVISNVAEDHTGVAGLAKTLSEHLTVISFDRRGRSASGDPQPYDPTREIEDIAALIDIAGGSAALTSGSGGCAITLDAASALGDRVTGLYLYEPPFIVDDSRPPAPTDYIEHVEKLVAAGKRGEAVEYVMTEMIGVPAEYIEPMKQDPSWNEMARYAHTYAYEGRSLRGLMDGKPLPADRWSIDAPIAVAVGGNSEPYFRVAADALAALLPKVTVLTLPGQDHGAFWAAPEPVAEQIREFLLGGVQPA